MGRTATRNPDRLKRRLRAWLGVALSALLSVMFGIIMLRRRVMGQASPQDPKRVLLVRCNALMGDLINGLSAAYAVRRRWPNARVTFVTPPAWKPLASRCSAIDEVVGFDCGAITHMPACLNPVSWWRSWRMVKVMRDGNFDVAVSLYGHIAGIVVGLSGATQRIGYASEAPPLCFDDAVAGSRRNGALHEAKLVTALIAEQPPEWQVIDRTNNLTQPTGIGTERPLIVLHPGATHGTAKRWPIEHWANLATRLRRSGVGTLAIVGLQRDHRIAVDIKVADPRSIDLTGCTDLDELMGVLYAADAVVSGDSGPAHLARAVGTPVVALHGPTDPVLHGPGDPRCVVLHTGVPCGPCYNFKEPAECQYGDILCMRWLEPAGVANAVASILETSTP